MRAVLALPALLLLLPAGVSQEPLLHPPCADAPAPVLFAQWDTQLENLAFDGDGTLYVSDLGGDRMLAFTPDGAGGVAFAVPGMHGLAFDAEGRLWHGASGPQGIEVRAFDPETGSTTVMATGLPAANGMAFDESGNLFVSSPLTQRAPYLVWLPVGHWSDWAPWGDAYGTNGLWHADGRILAAVTADQSSPILSISTSDPADVEVVAELTLGAATLQPGAHAPRGDAFLAPKGLDDLTLAPDGMIYAAAHVTGELLRVDPATGEGCAYASGFEEPTSVRVAHGFGAWDGWLFVTDMGGTGVSALFGPGAGAIWALPLG